MLVVSDVVHVVDLNFLMGLLMLKGTDFAFLGQSFVSESVNLSLPMHDCSFQVEFIVIVFMSLIVQIINLRIPHLVVVLHCHEGCSLLIFPGSKR